MLKDGICYFPDVAADPFGCYDACFLNILPSCPPTYEDIYDINRSCKEANCSGTPVFTEGTCSPTTERLLMETECIHEVFEQPGFIQNTITQLIQLSCSYKVSDKYTAFQQESSGQTVSPLCNEEDITPLTVIDCDLESSGDFLGQDYSDPDDGVNSKTVNRLAPAQSVLQYPEFTLRTKLNYENTRHRYPWVCSLRSIGAEPEHLCAVTLLSIPPQPTVVVGAAHCTYICKDIREIAIPVCCCSEGVEDCSEDKNKCGEKPRVYEMDGDDVEILCGEWETGDTPRDLSNEPYNVILKIQKIVRHPNFKTKQGFGPISGSDLAIFKVDDSTIKNKASLRLYPACLPNAGKQKQGNQTGIHTGWSRPPPFHFIEKQAAGYLPFYRDFFKQWHYKMDILDECRDPLIDGVYGGNLELPSNSSYPPGTVCATDFTRQSCFSTGDSGSPLMVAEKNRPMRYYAEGILSFVKGCDVFTFGATDNEKTKWQLNQQSQNPSTYTKLSCFLPWIAKQYGLEYKSDGETDPACYEGQGDLLDGKKNDCTITPSNLVDSISPNPEKPCIFPFHYNGKVYDKCVLYDEDGFVYPVFRCPIRNITTKVNGVNSYPSLKLNEGLCPNDSEDATSDLNPDIDCNDFARRAPFSQCKNNCPGGKINSCIR